ncbi:MAG: hypothetical protein JRH16_19695 [Deltaproteobacteria bacterium]|nr:hypothetical protein [Deltaproteobacteria bacterium]
MKKYLLMPLLLLASALGATAANADPIYADSLFDSEFVTAWGSGDVTGAPDGGGLFLGDFWDPPNNSGMIIVEFFGGFLDGDGDDIFVVDVFSLPNETANISVSNHIPDGDFFSLDGNGFSWTLIGEINAVDNSIDIDGLFSGPIFFVKIESTAELVSIDVDAVGAHHAVPQPSSALLLAFGLVGLGCGAGWPDTRRHRRP